MKFGVITLPRQLRRRRRAARRAGTSARWSCCGTRDRDLRGVDAVVVPGGFSYGDYLRAGAIARFSPVMEEVVEFARAGGLVMGICNGFQVLCEAGLLPGALLPNAGCASSAARSSSRSSTTTRRSRARALPAERLSIPVKHTTGRYYAPPTSSTGWRRAGRWCCATRRREPERLAARHRRREQRAGNVFGLMPHPEHAVDPLTGSTDGLAMFASMRGAGCRRRPRLRPSPQAPRPRPDRRRVRADRREARPRAERGRAGDVLAAVVRALRLQALQEAAAHAADRGPARA